jgi:ElaA protein
MIKFVCTPFYELSLDALYRIMRLRQEVFVLEQNCTFIDADGWDQDSWHLQGFDSDGDLVVYSRLIPKEVAYTNYVSIGRVVNARSVRGTGAGKILMQESIKRLGLLFPNQEIKIGAQSYLLGFYGSLGFVPTGDEYMEDGIPHTAMILKSSV